jgi:hypothetical protein
MRSLVLPRLISCDEAGFTGNDMLKSGQPHFAYASHDLALDEATDLLREARRAFPVQMPELKAALLLKSARGRKLLEFVLSRVQGRYITTLYEKKLSLACKLFEYIYEPVLQSNNMLFYTNNLHRFVAMYLYIQLVGAPVRKLADEFERFMRSLDPSDAPTLLGSSPSEAPDPMIGQILRFARGYNVLIAAETRRLNRSGEGKWILDLTTTAIFSHLAAWGERHDLIEVVCDDSKPLLALGDAFDVMINRPERVRLDAFGKRRAITWNMAKPLAFASSASHPGVELADLLAGVAAAVPRSAGEPALQPLAEHVLPHMHEDCILPDFGVLDLSGKEAPVNWLVLEELASRADAGDDPLLGMEEVYAIAKLHLPSFHAALSSKNISSPGLQVLT